MRLSLPLALALAGASCRAAAPDAPAERASACPGAYAADGPRAERLLRLLASAPGGQGLDQGGARVCFGPADGAGITPDHALLLDASMSDGEAAARLGHLLLHRREGLPFDGDPDLPCDARVDRALQKEARAHALELRLGEALGASAQQRARLGFGEAIWSARPDEREPLLLAYLRTAREPQGPGALADSYRRRCPDAR